METTSQTFARKKPDQLVYLELGSGNGGMLLSISEDGFRFRSVSPIRSDGLVPFAFSLDGAHRLQGIGEIEWLERDAKSGGMRFADVSAEFRAAVTKWLATDSRGPSSGREVTPAAATPLDTMEQIREDLRRGYKATASSLPDTETPELADAEHPEIEDVAEELETDEIEQLPKHKPAPPPPFHKTSSRKQSKPFPTPPPPALPKPARPEPPKPEFRTPEPKREVPPPPPAPPERRFELPRFSTPLEDDRPKVQPRHHNPIPPNAPQPDSTSSKSVVSPSFLSGSAFVKNASPATPVDTPPASPATAKPHTDPTHAAEPAKPAEPSTYMRTFTLTDTGDVSPASLQNPQSQYHPHSHSHAHPQPARPFIPAPDVSYDAAWDQSSKLTIPQDSPHLSRAAAGAIIGIALAVIIGTLTFNFRHDIGSMVIDLGQRISGEKTASPESAVSSAPQTPADTPPDSNPSNDAANPSANTTSPQPSSHPAPAPKKQEPSQKQGAANDASAAEKPAKQYSINPPTAVAIPPKSVPNPAGKVQMIEPTPAGAEEGSGQQEFEDAREILRGSNRKGEIAHAVNLLWSAVRKGYVPAEVTLGDLYRRGEGVEKNCDQAQVLLVTASRRGSPDARRILEFMAEHGCN